MSKKKTFSGSTMTLKDFHGGSIPSDLSLPSAPGIVVRTPDRSGLTRQVPGTWGNPSNRSDYRSRPGSAGATRNFDEKSPFLSYPVHIGRNFDEDERKPLYSFSFPRRSFPDDREDRSFPVQIVLNPKPEPVSGRSESNPGAVSQFQGVNNGQVLTGSVWATRKELGFHQQEHGNVSRFTQVSALEKVSSGNWQSKLASTAQQKQQGFDVVRFPETEIDDVQQNKIDLIYTEGYQSCNVDHVNGRSDFQSYNVDQGNGYVNGVRVNEEFPDHESVRNRGVLGLEYGNYGLQLNSDGIRLGSAVGKLDGVSQAQLHPQVQERPKLKLLPRTKQVEMSVSHIVDQKLLQSYQCPVDSGNMENINQLVGNRNPPKPVSAEVDGGNRVGERPKLNLIPRTQPVEQPDGSMERERKNLFGGARPRELVLKERGVDDVVINHFDLSQPTHRGKQELSKPDPKSEPTVPMSRSIEKHENQPLEKRTVNRTNDRPDFLAGRRDLEKKDHRADGEKTDLQRSSWRNEQWRSGKETEKQHERRQEPENWRKSVDPQKFARPLSAPDTPSARYGRAASALELAQAFSRSVSDAGSAGRIPSQSGFFTGRPGSSGSIPGRNAVPFSRLTDMREFYSGAAQRRINGY